MTQVRMNLKPGEKYNHLTVIERTDDYINPNSGKRRTRYLCECDCENHTRIKVVGSDLISGNTKSCGCYQKESARKVGQSNKIHGMSNTPIGQAYYNMMQRCCNPKSDMYSVYGGRGITVCERWRDITNSQGIKNFIEDMQPLYKSGYWLERLDPNGNYCPENCTWVPPNVQFNNKQYHRRISYYGTPCDPAELNRALGFSKDKVLNRLNAGDTPEEAGRQGEGKRKRYINAVSFIDEFGHLIPAETEKIPGFDNLYAGDQTIAKDIISRKREYTFGQLIKKDTDDNNDANNINQ